MKIATIFAFVFASASADALAQGAGDAMEKLRACSLLAPAERLECLEKLSRDIAPPSPARPAASPAPEVAPAADNWIVSETTSPLDYTPVAIATALSSGGPEGAILQLSIQCRGGRTDLVITGPALVGRAEDYVVSFRVNDGPPVVAAGGPNGRVSVLVSSGEVEIGLQQVSELMSNPDVEVIGMLPSEFQQTTTYAASITTSARQPDAAKALIRHLATPEAMAIYKAKGLGL